jgi:prepilin-type N-terminal cleavage/methylation domain-containing protein
MANNKRGFTLIETLIVFSLLGVLAIIFLSSLNPVAQIKKGRDTNRRSDLSQYRNALESYAAANHTLYPRFSDSGLPHQISEGAAGIDLCEVLTDGGYTSGCPVDDRTAYYYWSDGGLPSGSGTPDATQYVLWTDLETGDYWVVCADGRVGETSVDPAGTGSSNCPL